MVTHNPRDSPSLLTFIHPSFLYFIHQYVSDTWQERLTSQPSQQHSGRAEEEVGAAAPATLQANLVAHLGVAEGRRVRTGGEAILII